MTSHYRFSNCPINLLVNKITTRRLHVHISHTQGPQVPLHADPKEKTFYIPYKNHMAFAYWANFFLQKRWLGGHVPSPVTEL